MRRRGGTGAYGSYEVGNNETCNLSPGLYVFTGTAEPEEHEQALGDRGDAALHVQDATTPRACVAPGEAGGIFDAKNGEVRISAGSTQMPGMVVAYDRNNSSMITLQGNGDSVLTGNVYAPNSLMDANGNACHTVANGAIVIEDIYMNGNNNCLNVANGVPAVSRCRPADCTSTSRRSDLGRVDLLG